MSRYLMATAAFAVALTGTAAAKSPIPTQVPPQLQRLLACRGLSDGAARLACFDREAGAAAQGFARGDIVAVDREKIRSTKRTLFGLAIPNLGLFGDDGNELKQVEGVKSTGFNRDGGYIFRLSGRRPLEPDRRQADRPAATAGRQGRRQTRHDGKLFPDRRTPAGRQGSAPQLNSAACQPAFCSARRLAAAST